MSLGSVLLRRAHLRMVFSMELMNPMKCGVAYSEKINYKNGLQHGDYILYEEGYLAMEGQFYNDLLVGEWKGYEYGLLMWTEVYKNDQLLSYVLFEYHDNGQIALKESFDDMDQLDGISEAYHSNGQLKSSIKGNIVKDRKI